MYDLLTVLKKYMNVESLNVVFIDHLYTLDAYLLSFTFKLLALFSDLLHLIDTPETFFAFFLHSESSNTMQG